MVVQDLQVLVVNVVRQDLLVQLGLEENLELLEEMAALEQEGNLELLEEMVLLDKGENLEHLDRMEILDKEDNQEHQEVLGNKASKVPLEP